MNINSEKRVSLIIPAYNEAHAITQTVKECIQYLQQSGWQYEVIVIDDASSDGTGDAARAAGAMVVTHPKNIGYGGALRTGIESSSFGWVATIDADCSYPAQELLKLFPYAESHDMVIGARRGKHYWGTMFKYPARLLFLMLAEFVVGKKIPDVNSGLRLMRKSIVVEMLPRLSRGFSFSTTVTLSFLSSYRFVHFVSIEYLPRVGSSKVRYIRDTLRTLQLMLETIVYYNPIKAGVLLMLFPCFFGLLSFIMSVTFSNLYFLGLGFSLFCWALLFLGIGFILFMIFQTASRGQVK